MTSLILEEIDMEGEPEEVGASLRKEAEIFFDFSDKRDGGRGVERFAPPPPRAGPIERGMRRFIWWCLGCPIRGSAH
jgi:hypothetical protein